ncbi:pyridoxal-phosphate dependent enzyme [Microvirga antarctica]|uniref:pyridoxal-phosphate dependent enzyme n=1 Tax=Microvirga antarctica TaxID=2819233 RepID=UPI001B3008E2|nr:pyridoxal-phosphate dependent enzyme [Microvirga antarctica]
MTSAYDQAPTPPAESFGWIRDRIAKVPRVPIALTPTPLHEAPNLARELGGPRIFVKRDDMTGVALGGNKLRNLEFRLAHALKDDPDTVIVGLDLQSNSARQTVGACNKLGLKTILVLEGRPPQAVQGNLLVDYLLGAEIHFASDPQDQRRLLDSLAQRCRADGGRPHILNDNPMFDVASAIAYIETTLEILEQMERLNTRATDIYMSSSGKGQAGIVLAQRITNAGFRMRGITATSEFHVPSRTAAIANDTARLLELDVVIGDSDIDNDGAYVGERYGVPSAAGIEAVRLFARTEGIVLDPIYTGKAAAGMIGHIREGRYGPDDVLVFVHTGGMPAIFTWNDLWRDAGAAASFS